jgi:hypothetical protein
MHQLARGHWNRAFGEPTPIRVQAWVRSLEGIFAEEVARGACPEDALRQVEALIVVIGRMTSEEIQETFESAAAAE